MSKVLGPRSSVRSQVSDQKLDQNIPHSPNMQAFPGLWELPLVMWNDHRDGRCSMADACSNPPDAEVHVDHVDDGRGECSYPVAAEASFKSKDLRDISAEIISAWVDLKVLLSS